MTHEFVDWIEPIVICIYVCVAKIASKALWAGTLYTIKYKLYLLFHTFFDNDFFSVHTYVVVLVQFWDCFEIWSEIYEIIVCRYVTLQS